MSHALKYHHIEPNEQDIEISKKAKLAFRENDMEVIQELLRQSSNSGNFKEALLALFESLSHGEKVTIAPSEQIFTSQEAANFLNVSRPYINRLLDSQIITSYKDGSHRRVSFKDLVDYKVKREAAHKGLDLLAKDSQDNEMGW